VNALRIWLSAILALVLLGCASTARNDAVPASIASDPSASGTSAESAYRRGNALLDSGQYATAIDAYDGALLLDPNHSRAHTNRGLCLRMLDRMDEAVASYRRALEIEPDDPVTLGNLAYALEACGDAAGAVAVLEQLAKLRPDNLQSQSDLAHLLYELGRYDEAATAYTRVIRLDPGVAGDWYNLGLCHYAQEHWPDALESWLAALTQDPKHTKALEGVAVAYWRLKDYDHAWQAVARARRHGVAFDPGFISALQSDSGRLGPP